MRSLAQDAVSAMGGAAKLQAVRTFSMKGGTGTRMRLGQTVHVGDPETPAQLKNVTEIADLANGRASLDYELTSGPFTQHRHEILTKNGGPNAKLVGIEIVGNRPVIATSPSGLFSWGTQNSPEFLLRRNIVSLLLEAADSAAETPPTAKVFNDKTYSYATARTKSGEDVRLYFDPDTRLPAGFEVTDTETMLGDVPAEYILADYKTVDGVTLPARITIKKGGQAYSDVQFASIAVNEAAADAAFAIPEAAQKEADQASAADDYSPVALMKIAPHLYFARAYSHNSMIVEFPKWLAVVEAPYTEAQTNTLVRVLKEQFPEKPIKYAAVTHHHYDHTGGVRAIVAEGATILVAKRHEPALRELIDAPHTHPPDELESRRKAQPQSVGALESYDGKKVISDGGLTLELYAISGSPHVDPMVLAYVPSARALFQSDLFFPGTGSGPASPEAVHLLNSIRTLKLRVETNVGGHGGVGPFAELVKAVQNAKPPAAN